MNNTPTDVWLLSMPWTTLTEPNLGLSILSSKLRSEQISTKVWNLNLSLLQYILPTTYYSIANVYALNDFLFTHVFESDVSARQMGWLREKTEQLIGIGFIKPDAHGGVDGVMDQLLNLRNNIIPAWLQTCAQKILASNPALVGCSCMFDQTISSLAICQVIKSLQPEMTCVLGGYAVRQPTAGNLLASFDCVDAICLGEGENVIIPLADAARQKSGLQEVPGIIWRDGHGKVRVNKPAQRLNMNDSPVPDFTDYYDDAVDMWDDHKIEVKVDRLPIETSRGCWWGAKHHCVFCGIHDEDMAYRSRTADNMLEILDKLAGRYEVNAFRFSDYILPYQFYNTLLPRLAERGSPYEISTEIKANISPEKFDMLVQAGFVEIQPGIESFSSSVLRKMDKGVTASQNVYTIMLGERGKVVVHYNLLYGLPNETAEEVEAMLLALPRLFHLRPPSTCLDIQITRYAPLQSNPERFGIPPSTYDPSYDLIFSKAFVEHSGFSLNDFAYYFERPFEYPTKLHRLYKEINAVVEEWRTRWRDGDCYLMYEPLDGGYVIKDTRRSRKEFVIELTPDEATVLDAMNSPVSETKMIKQFEGRYTEAFVNETIRKLNHSALLFRDEDKWLNLVLPESAYRDRKHPVVDYRLKREPAQI